MPRLLLVAVLASLQAPGAAAGAVDLPHEMVDEAQAEAQETWVVVKWHAYGAICEAVESCHGEGTDAGELCVRPGVECIDATGPIDGGLDRFHALIDDLQGKSALR